MKKNKILSAVTAAAIAFTAFGGISSNVFPEIGESIEVSAETDKNEFTFDFDEDTGTLTISGKGIIQSTKYSDYKDKTRTLIIGEGIESISPIYGGMGFFFPYQQRWSAFDGYDVLENVSLPESYKKIDYDSFKNCKNLCSINIPEGVESIEDGAFFGCESLADIKIPDSVEYIGSNAFDNTAFLNNLSGDLKYADNWLIKCDDSVSEAVIKDGTKGIAGGAFYVGYDSESVLTSVVIPDSVKCIGASAFSNCRSLESIDIPSGVSRIYDSTFSGCDALETVNIPDSVNTIDYYAFYNCTSLKELFLPYSVTKLDGMALGGCESLEKLTVTNPECELRYMDDNKELNFTVFFHTTTTMPEYDVFTGNICGYEDSTAKEFADFFGYNFESLGDAPQQTEPAVTTTVTTAKTTTTTTAVTTTSKTTKKTKATTTETTKASKTTTAAKTTKTTKTSKTTITTATAETTAVTTAAVTTTEAEKNAPEASDETAIEKMNELFAIDSIFSGFVEKDESDSITVGKYTYYRVTDKEKVSSIDELQKRINNTCAGELRDIYIKNSTRNFVEQDGVLYAMGGGRGSIRFDLSFGVELSDVTDTSFTATTKEDNMLFGKGAFKFVLEDNKWLIESYDLNVDENTDPVEISEQSGDSNGDGKVNVRDAAFIAAKLAQGKVNELPLSADFNGDGKVNVRDAASIAKFLATGKK